MDGTLRVARCFLDSHDARAAKELAVYLKGLNTTSDGRHFVLDSDAVKTIDSLIATAGYLASIGSQADAGATPTPMQFTPKVSPDNAKSKRTTQLSRGTAHVTQVAHIRTPISEASAAVAQAQPANSAAGAPAGVESVFVPRGTIVVVALDNEVTSYSAASREPLSYTVVQDVIVSGHVVAKAGDEATGLVLEAQQGNEGGPYGIGWKAANLRVDVEKVNNFCGDSLSTRFIRSEYRRRQGLFGAHQDLEIIKGQKYIARIAHPQKVCGEATNASQLPVPADALGPDN